MKDKLVSFGLFDGLEPDDLNAFAQMCRQVKFKTGDLVFEAGQDAKHIYLVLSGTIELRFNVVYYHAGVDIALERVNEGDILGWSALVPPYKYTLSSHVMEDCELLEFSHADILKVCETDQRICAIVKSNVAGIVGHRFHALQEMLIKEIQESLRKQDSLA